MRLGFTFPEKAVRSADLAVVCYGQTGAQFLDSGHRFFKDERERDDELRTFQPTCARVRML